MSRQIVYISFQHRAQAEHTPLVDRPQNLAIRAEANRPYGHAFGAVGRPPRDEPLATGCVKEDHVVAGHSQQRPIQAERGPLD